MPYTHLNNNGYKDQPLAWNGMYLSESTQNHRDQLKHGMDDFTNFYWRGVDAFKTFGAFIINNKGTLKFYNGPTYSNEYSKPQFESAAGQLTGVTFQIQKIDFTIGVYWINEKDYRQLINWLNPYEINTLSFDFEPNYYYQVKLASIADGPRQIVGREFNINYKYVINNKDDFNTAKTPVKYTGETRRISDTEIWRQNHVYDADKKDLGRAIDSEYEYYTEMKLTFEIQGPACAYHKIPYVFDNETQGYDIIMSYSNDNIIDASDLETPIKILYDLDTTKVQLDDKKEYTISLTGVARYKTEEDTYDEVTLFSTTLKNLTFLTQTAEWSAHGHILLEYDSASGLLFLLNGDGEYFLLNTLTTTSQGQKILNSLMVNKYIVAGKLNFYNFDWHNLSFVTSAKVICTTDDTEIINTNIFGNNCQVITRGRTNLI